jgi:hypothetical protein
MIIFIIYIFIVLCPYIFLVTKQKKKQRNTKKAKRKNKETQKKQKKNKETQKIEQKEKLCYFIPGEPHPKFARDKLTGGSQCHRIPAKPWPKFAGGKIGGPTCHRDRCYPWRIGGLMLYSPGVR